MAELFEVDRTVITKRLKNIFIENELNKNSVCAKIAHTASDRKNYQTEFYNLDAIIAVGYRVNSKQAIEKANEEYEKFKIIQDKEYISSMNELYSKYLSENNN